jgi:hypothetical protein
MRSHGDPRPDHVADRLVTEFEALLDDGWDAGSLPDDLSALLDGVFLDSVPGARRILRQLGNHGWIGWTNIRRIQPLASGQSAQHRRRQRGSLVPGFRNRRVLTVNRLIFPTARDTAPQRRPRLIPRWRGGARHGF